jgi:hypothetical protein
MSRILTCLFIFFTALPACHEKSTQKQSRSTIQVKEIYQRHNSAADMSNPALLYGTSIGELIQQLYKQGQWNELLKFISDSSIRMYGRSEILQSFQRTEFGYDITLKSKSVLANGLIQLNYQTVKFGTIGILRMLSIVENDTVKIIIKSIHPAIEF